MKTKDKMQYFRGLLMISLIVALSGCKDFKYDTYSVTEKPYVDKTSVELFLGADADMASVQLISSPAGKQFTWTSQNDAVATVTQSGLVTATGEGFTNIIVTSENDLFQVKVQVLQWVPVEKIMLDVESVQRYWYGVMDKFKINALYEPPNTTETDLIEWSTSDPSIATVTSEGWVTYRNTGRVTIFARAKGVEESVVLTVLEQPVYRRYVEGTTDVFTPEWIDRSNWEFPGYQEGSMNAQVSYSSQATNEGAAPNGRVVAMLDDRNGMFWHARWDPASDFPHWFIVKLVEDNEDPIEIGGVLIRNRENDNRGQNGFQLYTSDVAVTNINDLAEASIWTSCGRFTHSPNGSVDYNFAILPPYPKARYVKMYFGPEYKNGTFQYVMISQFGLYRPKQDAEE